MNLYTMLFLKAYESISFEIMNHDDLYSFVFRGVLAGVALDKVGHTSRERFSDKWEAETSRRLGLPLLDEDLVSRSRKMALVYIAICSFENSVREFVSKKLLEEKGKNWWETSANSEIRKKVKDRSKSESGIRWLTPRGGSMIYYTDFGDLFSIISHPNNWGYFEVHIGNKDWAQQIIFTLEKSRNIIMHSGELAQTDIERVGMYIRDWITQVG